MINRVVYLKKDVRNVTEFYYNIIFEGLRKNGTQIMSVDNVSLLKKFDAKKTDYILVTSLYSFFLLYLKGYRNFIYWFQGITPEEVEMMFHSRLKYYVYSLWEKVALKKCRYKFFINKYQIEHYNKKYNVGLKISDGYIMPCFNTLIDTDSFSYTGKYDKNVFCYAGGIQAWQGFEDILRLYSKIEQKDECAFLKVLSKDLQIAEELINKHGIKHYSLASVPQEQVQVELKECKFGFIIRENNIVNNVATPTKLATYIGTGIIPIFTSSIYTYRDMAEKYSYLCCIKDINDVTPIHEIMKETIDVDELRREYIKIFNDCFNVEDHINNISLFFKH